MKKTEWICRQVCQVCNKKMQIKNNGFCGWCDSCELKELRLILHEINGALKTDAKEQTKVKAIEKIIMERFV